MRMRGLMAPLPSSSTGVPTYQAPAASVGSILSLQAQLPQPPLPPAAALVSAFQLAPLNTSIPPIPSKFAAAAAGGEFVDFNELLYCIELGSGEESSVHVHLADDQQLALSRKRPISSFEEWVKCFTVYTNTLCAHQPTRGPDMLGYLFVIASSLQEFSLPGSSSIRCSLPQPHLPPLPQLPIPLAPTPVRVLALSRMLSAHPQRQWVDYLLRGLSFGFSTGYTGPHHPRHSHNLPSAASRPEVISSYIAKECASGHTAGPFMHPPFPNFIVNPLGAVPKKRTGKWRLIMHLSFPPGASINDGIDIANFPLRYSTVADAMDSCMRLGRGALMAKLDVQSAFRLCPVQPDEHHLLGMCWQGRYFFDRVLPFGLRSAPFVFNTLAEALEWIARQHGLTYIHHYLDDFFVAGAPDSPACSAHLRTLTSLCNTLIPLAKEKLEGPATQLEYLRILLDTDLLEARLLLDKLHDLKSALSA